MNELMLLLRGYDKVKVKCLSCSWTGQRGDCFFKDGDFYCPECGFECAEIKEEDNAA